MRVLIVHPESDYRNSLKYSLDNLGYPTDAAQDQSSAMASFSEHRHDFVFIGHQPPDLDGLILTRSVRENQPGTKVVLVAPSADLNLACAAIHHHVFDFFHKKVEFRQLLLLVEEVAEEQARNQSRAAGFSPEDQEKMLAREEQHSRLALEYAKLKQAYEDLRENAG